MRAVFAGPVFSVELRHGPEVRLVELTLPEWEAVSEAWRRFCDAIGL